MNFYRKKIEIFCQERGNHSESEGRCFPSPKTSPFLGYGLVALPLRTPLVYFPRGIASGMSSEGMQPGGTLSGRPFCIFDAKRKIHPAPHAAAERGKMRSPDIECKNKKRSYAGENDSQHIRALALGLDWHSSPRVTSPFILSHCTGLRIFRHTTHPYGAGLDLPNTFSSCIIISIARRFTQ